ncbi:hypothetical protein [Caballeronia sp. S22]|uniref:hypothetical protein n=1 Tax=Caballeronia sp. S22 TaxID=3137182 RepID=UPI003530CB71
MKGDPPSAVTKIGRQTLLLRLTTYGGMLLLFVVLVVTFSRINCDCPGQVKAWFETLNGATWPDAWTALCKETYGLPFALVMALRTILSLGALLALVAGLLEYFIRHRKRAMKFRNLLDSRQGAVLAAVAFELRLESDQLGKMKQAAAAAAKDWDDTFLPNISVAAKAMLDSEVPEDPSNGGRK